MAGTQPTAPEPSGDGPKKKKRKGAGAFRRSPLKGYNPAPAWYGWGSAQLDGSPVFLWPDVPRMLRDPQIRFVERMWRAPFQKVKWSVSAPNKAVAQFVGAMLRRFWVRSLPKLLSRYFRYGFAPGAAEFAPIRGRVRLVKVRAVEPLDAQARVWNDDHERAGELAGFDVAPHGALAPNQFKGNLTICSPHLFWFAGHGDLTQFHDAPPLAGCFEPWLEKRGRGGAIQSRKLWFRKAAWRGGILYYPEGVSNVGTAENPQYVDNQDLARQALDTLEAGGTMAISSDVNPATNQRKWEYIPPEAYSDVGGLREYPQDLDREILVGAGIPPEVLEASEVGSGWSGRMVPLMGYLGTIDELAGLLLEACDAWLGPLVALNFGENAWYEVKPLSLVDELQQQQQQGAMPGGGQPGLNPSSLFDGKPPAGGPGGPMGGGGDGPQQPGPGGAGGPLSLSVTIPEDLIRKAERAAGGHKYACAYVDVPRELAAQLKTLAYSIPNTDLHDPANGKGRELESHVTVRFGLLTDEAADLAPIAADAPPARVTFTGIGHFDGAAEGKPYDVVFAAVDSADLRRLNRELAALPHHDTHPEYVPHATIAYVRAGTGAQWARRLTLMAANLTGRDFTAPALVLSARDGSKTEVPFGASTGPRELSWGARGPLELGWTPYKGPKGGTGWVSDTGEVRYQESKPADDEGRAPSPHGRGGDEFDMPEYAHLQRVPGEDHNAIRAEVHKRAVAEGMNPADLHEKASAILRQMLETRRQKGEPLAAHDLTRRAYETVLNEHVYRKEMEAAGAHFAETYFDDDNPLRRAKKYLKALDNSDFEEDDVPEDVRAAVAEDLATMPTPKLAKLAIRAAFDDERAELYARALEHAGAVAPAPADKFGPDADPADYAFIPNGELNETQLAVLNAAGRALGGAVNSRWIDPTHELGGIIVRRDGALARAVGDGYLADLTDRLGELFQASKSEPMLAVGDVPASARDYGGTSGSKGTGEFRPEEGWNPNAVATYKRISDGLFVKQRAAGDADSEPFELVHRKDVPDLTRLPAPYWEGLRDDGETDADLEETAQRRADKASEEGVTRKRDIAGWKGQIREHQKAIRAHRDAWNRALAGVPEDERPEEPDWEGPDSSALTDQHYTREDHGNALSDLSYALGDHASALAAEVEAARAHAEEYRERNGKHAEARAKHVAAWNDAHAKIGEQLARYREARAQHADPDLKLNDELAKATETWRNDIPDTAEDEDAEAALQAVHEALDDIDNGDYPDHTEEPIAAEDYDPDADSELPSDTDGTPEELADLAEAAAEARAGQLENLSYEVDAHVAGLPEASRKWRASARADLDAARERVREALELPEDVLTAEDGRAALEALAKQLDAFGKRLAGEGPRELSATVGPDGGDPNAMIAGQTNRLMRQRKAQLARALAVAMVRVQLGAAESGDAASAGPKLEQLAALAGGGSQQQQPAPQPQQQAAPGDMGEGVTLGPLELSWEPYIGKRGARAGQQVGWIDTETKQVRYQKSKPGEHAQKRQTRQASESRGREILSRIAGRGATAAEIGELVDHLPVMSTRELRRARIMLDAKFGKSRTQRDMVNALLARVGGLTATDGTRADGTRAEAKDDRSVFTMHNGKPIELDGKPLRHGDLLVHSQKDYDTGKMKETLLSVAHANQDSGVDAFGGSGSNRVTLRGSKETALDGFPRSPTETSLGLTRRATADDVKRLAEAAGIPVPPAYLNPKRLAQEGAKPAGPPQPGEVRTVPTDSLKVDPGRFQFKLGTNKEGVTKELQGVTTFNPEFAGTILAWRDPADGKDYVVNGHHRHELAKRTGHPEMAVRWIAAKDAREARAKGALVNIAEGRGTAVDAAKFMRDAGVSPDELARHGVSLKGKLAADAATLTKLNGKAFDRLARGGLDLERALAVSKHLSDPVRQERLFDLLAKREEAGKDLSGRTVEELARQMAAAPKVSKTESTLWGDETTDEDTFVERAELAGYVRAQLAQEANDFGAVASQRRADRVAGAGNTLNTEENARRQEAAEEVRAHYDGRAHLKGGVSDALDAGAAKLKTAKSKKERERVRSETLEAVRNAVRGELDGLRKPDDGRGESGVDQVGGAAGTGERPAAGAEDGARPAAEPAGVASRIPPIQPEHQKIADRFGIPVEAVASVLGTSADELAQRDKSDMGVASHGNEVPAGVGPERSPDHPVGAARIQWFKHATGGTDEANVSFLKEHDPNQLLQSEPIQWADSLPSTKQYAEWMRQGHRPPPIVTSESDKGQTVTANRRRVLAAQQAGVNLVGWHNPINKETGEPLKYGDIRRAAEELRSAGSVSRVSATSPAPPNAAGAPGSASWMPGAQTARKPAEPVAEAQSGGPTDDEVKEMRQAAFEAARKLVDKREGIIARRKKLSGDIERAASQVEAGRAALSGKSQSEIAADSNLWAVKESLDAATAKVKELTGKWESLGEQAKKLPEHARDHALASLAEQLAAKYPDHYEIGEALSADGLRTHKAPKRKEPQVAKPIADAPAPSAPQPAAPQADPFAGATADHGPALAGIPRNNSAYVAGHLVRRMADGRYQIEGGRGFVTGTAEEIADRIRDSWRRQSGERTVALKALDRAAAHSDADPFSDPQAADAEAAARENVPDGARAVSIDEATRGRVGVVRRDPETGIARLVFDRGEEGRATDFEPLDARHSWRKPGGQTAPGAKIGPKTGDLFGDEPDAAPAQPSAAPGEHPRDRLGRLRSMIPHAGTGGGFSPQKGDAVATIGDEVAPGKYSIVGASRDGTKFTIRPDRATLTDDQRKMLRSDPAKFDKTVSASEVIPPSHGSIARRLAGIVADADTNHAGAKVVLDAAERDLAVTPREGEPVRQVAPKPAPVPREKKVTFAPEDIAKQAEAFKRHAEDGRAGLPGRRDAALAVMNQFRDRASVGELKDFARAVGVSDEGTRNQIGERLVSYALDGTYSAPKPSGTAAAPDYSKFDALLRTSTDRAQAEQIARATGVPIRPEAAAALPTKGNYANWLRGTDPAALKAAAGSPAVDRAELLDAVKQVYGDAVHAEAKKKSKQGIADLLAGAKPVASADAGDAARAAMAGSGAGGWAPSADAKRRKPISLGSIVDLGHAAHIKVHDGTPYLVDGSYAVQPLKPMHSAQIDAFNRRNVLAQQAAGIPVVEQPKKYTPEEWKDFTQISADLMRPPHGSRFAAMGVLDALKRGGAVEAVREVRQVLQDRAGLDLTHSAEAFKKYRGIAAGEPVAANAVPSPEPTAESPPAQPAAPQSGGFAYPEGKRHEWTPEQEARYQELRKEPQNNSFLISQAGLTRSKAEWQRQLESTPVDRSQKPPAEKLGAKTFDPKNREHLNQFRKLYESVFEHRPGAAVGHDATEEAIKRFNMVTGAPPLGGLSFGSSRQNRLAFAARVIGVAEDLGIAPKPTAGSGAAPAATSLDIGGGAANNAPAQQGGASVNPPAVSAKPQEKPKAAKGKPAATGEHIDRAERKVSELAQQAQKLTELVASESRKRDGETINVPEDEIAAYQTSEQELVDSVRKMDKSSANELYRRMGYTGKSLPPGEIALRLRMKMSGALKVMLSQLRS